MICLGLHWSQELRVASGIEWTADQESELTELTRSELTRVRLAQQAHHAQVVVLVAQGLQNKGIADPPGIGRVPVAR